MAKGREIEDIADLTTDSRNANQGTSRGRGMLETSLRLYGAGRSVLADRNGALIAGNKTVEVAAEIGLAVRTVHTDGNELVVVVRDDLDLEQDERARELAYADNRIAEVDYMLDPAILQEDLESGLEVGAFWSGEELAEITAMAAAVAAEWPPDVEEDLERLETTLDRASQLREKWQTARGQAWQIGRHRLMCGDSTSESDVARLLRGQGRVGLVISDPLYDLDVDTVRGAIGRFADAAMLLTGGRQAFNLVDAEWMYSIDFVWRHRRPRSFPSPYMPVFYHHNVVCLIRGKGKIGWTRPQPNTGSVIEIEGQEFVDSYMGHGKSALLFASMLRGCRAPLVADPFVGTGASLLGAEALGKTLLGMELDEATIAVALERCSEAGLQCTLVPSGPEGETDAIA